MSHPSSLLSARIETLTNKTKSLVKESLSYDEPIAIGIMHDLRLKRSCRDGKPLELTEI